MSNSETKIIKRIIASVVICVGLIFQPIACNMVDAGNVGVKVNLYGNSKGVDGTPLLTGMCWYNKYTEQFHEFPVFMQNVVWTKDSNEGSPTDESVTFNSSDGASFNADIAFGFTVLPEKVPHIFIKYRQELNVITRTNLRNKVREAFTTNASNYSATLLFGEKKNDFLEKVRKQLISELEPDGFIFDLVTIVGGMRAEPKVMDSINAVIQASQKALEAENKVKQSEAESRQKIAEAEGEAQSLLLVAKSQAEANKLITESITPELVKYKMVEKWDGIAPKFLGSNGSLLINMDEKK